MLASNLVISLRFLEIGQASTACYAKRKQICSTFSSFARYAK